MTETYATEAGLRAMGRMGVRLPGWDHCSIWGWDDREHSFYAQLWRNDDDSDGPPRVWLGEPIDAYPVTYPEVLAALIAGATRSTMQVALTALAGGAPADLGEFLRRLSRKRAF